MNCGIPIAPANEPFTPSGSSEFSRASSRNCSISPRKKVARSHQQVGVLLPEFEAAADAHRRDEYVPELVPGFRRDRGIDCLDHALVRLQPCEYLAQCRVLELVLPH